MSILSQLNSPAMYAICGGIVAFVALICIVFLIRAWRAGLAIGMDRTKMKRVIVSSATFSALPSVGILLGVIAAVAVAAALAARRKKKKGGCCGNCGSCCGCPSKERKP